jgi:hypothetical protein
VTWRCCLRCGPVTCRPTVRRWAADGGVDGLSGCGTHVPGRRRAEFRFGEIPCDAAPETVLKRLAALGGSGR